MTEDDWVAGVFVSNNGVDMDLESHIACKLPDGPHKLYAHPAQVSEAEALRLRREAFIAGVAWQKEMEAPPVAAPSGEAEKLGAWLSAALEDPIVCDEMKADIENWFKASTPPYPNGEALDWADLGARLKKKLADERIGLRDLEGKLGLSKSTLSRVCNGKHCTVKAYLAITAWLAPPSPIASEPKDAGSGEGQEINRFGLVKALTAYDRYWENNDDASEALQCAIEAYLAFTRTAPSGAKPPSAKPEEAKP